MALDDADGNAALQGKNGSQQTLTFLNDTNLALKLDEEPIATALRALEFKTEESVDLDEIDKALFAHQPDVACIPAADFFRLVHKGDHYYRGLLQATSKFTGSVRLRSLLVVRADDPAKSIDDLEGAKFGVLNRSCSTTWFSTCILLNAKGKRFDEFGQAVPVKAGKGWQNILDGVITGDYRATMIPEDVLHSAPEKKQQTKVIGEYAGALPGIVIARHDLNDKVRQTLLDALLAWTPEWNALYGPYKPFYMADLHSMFHDVAQLPSDLYA